MKQNCKANWCCYLKKKMVLLLGFLGEAAGAQPRWALLDTVGS
jgi:hypothetical protein